MRILHLCLSASYVEGLSYQENLLSQYHKKMGHEVYVIASLKNFSRDGEYVYDNQTGTYTNKYGIVVQRLAYKTPLKLGRIFRTYKGTYRAIENVNPDVIFCHGVQFLDARVLIRYMKMHPQTRLYADNHSDFSNSATNWISKNIQHKLLWGYYARKMNPYVEKFYGVIPARVDFLVDLYHLPKEKVELLVMGADDVLAEEASRPEVRKAIREQYGIHQDDFLLMNGGKIDRWKKQTLLLMDAVNQSEDPKLKLIVFGSVTPELKADVEKRCSDRVQYIGWVQSDDSYRYFAAADLVVFPGRHSVFWEQVAGQGIPMIVKHWEGTTHVACGGNVRFLHPNSVEAINQELVQARQQFAAMKRQAEQSACVFSYRDIARRCIEE